MGIISGLTFGGILVDLLILSIMITSLYFGYRRGLVGVMFKILVFIISLILVFVLYKPVSSTIMQTTQLDEMLSNAIRSNLDETSIKDGELIEPTESKISSSIVRLINSFITDALQKAENDAIGYVSLQLAQFMIRLATILILFIISRFLLLFIKFAAEIVANLPIIRMFNKAGGLIYGCIKGLLIIYIILAIFSVISPLISSWGIIGVIQDSILGNRMYNNNLLLNLLIK